MIVRESLLESKQVGILYHLMDYSMVLYNITNDRIGGAKNHKLSFTRNKNMYEIPDHTLKHNVLGKLVLDGDKMSNKYRIRPIQNKYKLLGKPADEYEETMTGIVYPLHVYLIKIEIYNNVFWTRYDESKYDVMTEVLNNYIDKYNVLIEYIK